MESQWPRLMAIVDADVAERAGLTMIDLADACLRGGARLIQVRAKDVPSGRFLEIATAIVRLARRARARVIVNDRADVARLAGADGVHVGQEDLAPVLARRIVGVEAIVGLSTHTQKQLDVAVLQAADAATALSYVAIGPVFATPTKTTGYDAIGVDRVRAAARRLRPDNIPLVAIGGITLETAYEVIQAGATTIAVISDLVTTGNPAARVHDYLERLTI